MAGATGRTGRRCRQGCLVKSRAPVRLARPTVVAEGAGGPFAAVEIPPLWHLFMVEAVAALLLFRGGFDRTCRMEYIAPGPPKLQPPRRQSGGGRVRRASD